MNYHSIARLIGSVNAAELIQALTGLSREALLLDRERELPDSVADAAGKIASGTPLQYITGRAFFYGDRYLVTPDVLIPQPDTEHLVDAALCFAKPGRKLLDLCTGSGCIAISILKRAIVRAEAVDISAPALEVARKNAELHKVNDRLELLRLDVLRDDLSPLIAGADIITANPPYINTDVIPSLPPDVRNEPRIALDGGGDGMDFYRRFLSFSDRLKPDAVMIFEIGWDQGERICELARCSGLSCSIKRDFGGNDRVAIIHKIN